MYQCAEHDNQALQSSDASIKHYDTGSIPNGIWGHLNDGELDAGLAVSHDLDMVGITRGFPEP